MDSWTYGVLDQQHLVLILGSGSRGPMTVQSVNAWQKSDYYNAHDGKIAVKLPDLNGTSPTILPADGHYTDSVRITMQTGSTAGVSVRYTLDGSNPTRNSLLYSDNAPVVLKQSTVVKARGFTATDSSDVMISSYSILSHVAKPSGSGLQYKYYEYDGAGWDSLKDFSQLTVKSSGVTDSFGVGMRLRAYKFAVHLSGAILIPSDGDYTFTVNSDAGAKFYLSENLLVNNNGAHSMSTGASGVVSLKSGYYSVALDYFMDSVLVGGRLVPGLSVYYASAAISKTKIPKSVLFSGDAAVAWFGPENRATADPLTIAMNKDAVTVMVGFRGVHRLDIVKLTGAVEMHFSGARATTYRIKGSALPAGVYMLMASDAAGHKAVKLVRW
ncbi:MAG: chitobiase/beta-hexosaminidase C-terminal domain-containing protein, partial [Chitinivibrionales bacterium]|nr:chitobiase/beta-hexosaminidase C-terminal domain-containing protein [Chitinivibrionales bacterium]